MGRCSADQFLSNRAYAPDRPIEETVKAMKQLQDEGKVKYLGMSECSPESLERALKIARIDAVQIEYSPWETGPERSGLLDLLRKHKISLVRSIPQTDNTLASENFCRSLTPLLGEEC